MRLSGPTCQAMAYPDGPDRPGLGCPRRPVRRISWSTGARPASRRREWSRRGCHRHFPDMITDVDAVARSERDERFGDPSWPGAVIEEVELVVTSRDRAHGRSGRWTGHETSEPLQHRLFWL